MARAVTDEFRSLLTRDRELVARVEILDADRHPILSTDPATASPLKVTELTVGVDETRTVRGDAHAVIAVPPDQAALVPSSASGLLSPISGATFRVWAGFRLPSTGQPELVPCGRYDIENCEITETAAGVRIVLDGQDLTGRLDVADITDPWVAIMGSEKLYIAELLIQPVLPNVAIVATPSGQTSGWIVYDIEANRLSELTSLMTSMGYVMFMDPDGFSVHLEPRSTTQDAAAWVYDESSIRVVPQIVNSLARARVYNGVVAQGENTTSDIPPVRASAWDTDPTSPTYYDPANPAGSRVGPRPSFMTSQYITTVEQAQGAADAELMRLRGLLQRVTLKVGVNPAMNVGDVIHVDRPGVGVVGGYVVQSVAFDLAKPNQMDVVCEERRVAAP